MADRAPKFFTIPKGAKPAQCRSCKAICYWIRTANDRPMLVDTAVDGGEEPTDQFEGRGLSHFATCPDADDHRKAR